jgi:predicted permease
MESLARDLRYAARGLLRTPAFTLAAVSALALGIGAGTAVFSVVDRLLFRSLPYPDAERLVSFGMVAPIVPQEFLLGYDYLDWRASQQPFESLGAWQTVRNCDLSEANPVRLRCAVVDAALLYALGIQPLAGRNFTPQEDRPKAPPAALISYGLWRSRFAGDPAVVGKPLPLDGRPATIVGVLPASFELPSLAAADVLVPMALDPVEQAARRTAIVLYAVGRLKPGVTEAQARAALQPLFAKSLESVPPGFRKDVRLRLRPLRDRQVQDARLASWMLLASVAAVLLIACANVANLLLARATARQRERAVRAALGAGRGRLIRQALTESVPLALAGGAAGCALAFLLLRLFVGIAPEGIPRLSQAGVDDRVLLFTLGVSLLCGMLFGLAPAMETPRPENLAGWRSAGTRRHWFRQSLVAAQIAVSLVLLTGASLLLRSLWNLQTQPLGMRTERVLTATVALGQTSYAQPERRLAFFEQWEARVRQLPGVAEVALSDSVPPAANPRGPMIYHAIDVEGRPRSQEGTGGPVNWRTVTPRYFAALGIPILRGRAFTEEDRDPSRHAAILSDTLACRMFPAEDPLGKRIRPGRIGPWHTVIGVAGNVKNTGLAARDDPEFYLVRSHSAEGTGWSASAVLRGAIDPRALAGAVRAQVARLDATLPVQIDTLSQRVSKLAERPRFSAVLLAIFAGMGLLLAAIGLYGVISCLVLQRTREIGVRMALGATPGGIARLVLSQAGRWAAAGSALGVAGSLIAVRLLRSMLFRVSANDPASLLAAVCLLLSVALLAAWLPARRAARVDPMEALRME